MNTILGWILGPVSNVDKVLAPSDLNNTTILQSKALSNFAISWKERSVLGESLTQTWSQQSQVDGKAKLIALVVDYMQATRFFLMTSLLKMWRGFLFNPPSRGFRTSWTVSVRVLSLIISLLDCLILSTRSKKPLGEKSSLMTEMSLLWMLSPCNSSWTISPSWAYSRLRRKASSAEAAMFW